MAFLRIDGGREDASRSFYFAVLVAISLIWIPHAAAQEAECPSPNLIQIQSRPSERQLSLMERQLYVLEQIKNISQQHLSRHEEEPKGTTPLPKDCAELKEQSGDLPSGQYAIYPDGGRPFFVYCDMEADGGGWTVFQRRINGGEDFYRGWADYKAGFGDLLSEHWLGNDYLSRLTNQKTYHLHVDLEDWEGNRVTAHYDTFVVAGESNNYRLTVAGYSGTAGDSMAYHNGHEFSTKDSDHDGWTTGSCAINHHGGWWYDHCSYANLNGFYVSQAPYSCITYGQHSCVRWYNFKGHLYSLKSTEMKLKP